MRITTDYSELMIITLDDLSMSYKCNSERIYFMIPDDQCIPADISNVLQLIPYEIS
jgi:hypothetical protein